MPTLNIIMLRIRIRGYRLYLKLCILWYNILSFFFGPSYYRAYLTTDPNCISMLTQYNTTIVNGTENECTDKSQCWVFITTSVTIFIAGILLSIVASICTWLAKQAKKATGLCN